MLAALHEALQANLYADTTLRQAGELRVQQLRSHPGFAACLVQQDLRRGALVKGLLLISPVLDVLDLPRGDADAIDLEGAGNLRFPLSLPSPLHYTAGQSFLSWFWSRWVVGCVCGGRRGGTLARRWRRKAS